MENIDLRCDLISRVMRADYSLLLKIKAAIEKKEVEFDFHEKPSEPKKRLKQEYSYAYQFSKDALIETTKGKNIHHAHMSKDEFLSYVPIFVDLIDSKGNFRADEDHYKKSDYMINRIRMAFRICILLGVMRKIYMSGRRCSAVGGKGGFLSAAEQAWKDRASTL